MNRLTGISPHPAHEHVVHPDSLVPRPVSRTGRVSAWLAIHLAVVFGFAGTIWLFFIAPLLIQLAPAAVQGKFFFYASGWVQLFALPLLVYVGNRAQQTSDAQSDANHLSQTHIARAVDEILRQAQDNGKKLSDIYDRLGGPV